MDCRKNKIQRNIFWYGINLITLIIFWGGLLRKNFTSDTISHMVSSDADVKVVMEQGRYLRALFDYILLKLGVRTTTQLSITMLFTFLLLAGAMLVIQRSFDEWIQGSSEEKIVYALILNLGFINVLFAEVLMFAEMGVYFGIAYLLAASGVYFYSRRKYFYMILALVAGTCFYQYIVIYTAVYIVFYVFLKERSLSWKVLLREIIMAMVCLLIGAFNLLSISILVKMGVLEQFSKNAGMGDIKLKLKQIIQNFIGLNKDASGIFPSLWIPLMMMLFAGGILIWDFYKKSKGKEIIFLAINSAGCFALLYVIPAAQQTFFFPPRMAFCFFLVQGLIIMSIYIMIDSKKKRKLLTLGCIGYLMVQYLFANFIVTNHFISNTLDKVYVKLAYEYILEYEQENNIIVENLCMINDIDAPAYYDEVHYTSDQINERSLGILSVSIMEVITGRKFNKVEMNSQIYETYFKDRNWDYFDPEEQIIIVGNTAYWCMF